MQTTWKKHISCHGIHSLSVFNLTHFLYFPCHQQWKCHLHIVALILCSMVLTKEHPGLGHHINCSTWNRRWGPTGLMPLKGRKRKEVRGPSCSWVPVQLLVQESCLRCFSLLGLEISFVNYSLKKKSSGTVSIHSGTVKHRTHGYKGPRIQTRSERDSPMFKCLCCMQLSPSWKIKSVSWPPIAWDVPLKTSQKHLDLWKYYDSLGFVCFYQRVFCYSLVSIRNLFDYQSPDISGKIQNIILNDSFTIWWVTTI